MRLSQLAVPAAVAFAFAFAFAACPAPAPTVDDEGCEHMKEGPAVGVTATDAGSTAPEVKGDHQRYDVTLIDVTGGKGGRVKFAAAEKTDFIFFTGADVPVEVFDSSDAPAAIESSVKSVTACTEVKGKHTVPLDVATYTLSFGPTTETKVSVVIEEAAGHVD
ncbi:MAG: hypothetical protein ACYC8T_32325 [Myxococcaceae bacterium]